MTWSLWGLNDSFLEFLDPVIPEASICYSCLCQVWRGGPHMSYLDACPCQQHNWQVYGWQCWAKWPSEWVWPGPGPRPKLAGEGCGPHCGNGPSSTTSQDPLPLCQCEGLGGLCRYHTLVYTAPLHSCFRRSPISEVIASTHGRSHTNGQCLNGTLCSDTPCCTHSVAGVPPQSLGWRWRARLVGELGSW